MKLPYTVEELQAVLPGRKNYGQVLRILARIGHLEYVEKLNRWNIGKLSRADAEQVKVGDILYISGKRFSVAKIGSDRSGPCFAYKNGGCYGYASYMICEPPTKEKELMAMFATLYIPKVGDTIAYEDPKTGMRYKCLVKTIREDGWLLGEPGACSTAFNPELPFWFILEVQRNNKRIYQW